jgi:hypothetical protein
MAQAPFRTAAITATGDITLGSSGQLTITAANGNLATSGSIQGATLTDGAFSTTAGAVIGVTTLTASGLVTSLGADLGSGGIVNTGAIAGATTITATGLVSSVGLDAGAGAITTAGTLSSGAATVTSLDASLGGITNAGAIAGATTIGASGTITGGTFDDGAGSIITGGVVTGATLTDGTFSTTGGALTGVTTLGMSGVLTVGSGGTTYTFPTARGTNGQILKLDGSGNLTFQDDGGSAGPGGASGNIQFNDGAGGFAGDASLNWDTTNDILELGNGGSTFAGLASNTQAVLAGATTSIDTFTQATYVAAKYLITAENTSSGEVHTQELLISADGTTTNFVPFADVFTGAGPLFTVNVTGTDPDVEVTNLDGANAINVQFMRTTLA